MPSTDLIVRILADTSSANTSFSTMGKNLAAVLGVGAAGGATVAVVQTAADFQAAMAKIQTAYNNTDFAPGTAKYSAAKDQILKYSGELATSFEGVAAVYNQGSRFVDEFGNKLPTDKVNEYTDTVLRLSKVSSDAMDPTVTGQRLDVFEKLFNQQNFAETGSAMAGLSKMHNLGEEPVWQTAIGIAQYGAGMGLDQAQALGIANYLVDRQAGGQMGGASIGRMFLRMDTAADAILDPETRYADVKKNRDAQERLDDLQTSLREAQAKESQMYGQHGLKTAYAKNPEAVMAEQDRIAKLQREIADQTEDIAHENDPNRAQPRGKMNLVSMAATAGVDPTAYAELFKQNPAEALLEFTRGLSTLDETQRGAAETKAGIVNVRDQKTINAMATAPDVIDRMINVAREELAHPTELAGQSATVLDTTNAKTQDLLNQMRGGVGNAGEPARAGADKAITDVMSLIRSGNWAELEKKLGDNITKWDQLNGIMGTAMPFVQTVLTGLLPALVLRGAAGGSAAAAAQGSAAAGAASTAVTAGGLGAAALGGAGALVAGGIGFVQLDEMKTQIDRLNNARQSLGLAPITMNFGDIHPGTDSAEQIFDKIKTQFVSAWNTAMSTHPVSVSVGGNYNHTSPR